MKLMGLIGGMSWESTVTYYQVMNRVVKETLGGLHSARCLLHSVDFHEIEECQARGDWDKSAAILARAARGLQAGGAEALLICTNTMHKVADAVRDAVSIPLLHIADATATELRKAGVAKTALLGTRYTMEQDFYTARLRAAGLEVLVPEAAGRAVMNGIIYDELCLGRILPESQDKVLGIIEDLRRAGAQACILGCTEIGLLVQQRDAALPLFDTALIHARAAALYSME